MDLRSGALQFLIHGMEVVLDLFLSLHRWILGTKFVGFSVYIVCAAVPAVGSFKINHVQWFHWVRLQLVVSELIMLNDSIGLDGRAGHICVSCEPFSIFTPISYKLMLGSKYWEEKDRRGKHIAKRNMGAQILSWIYRCRIYISYISELYAGKLEAHHGANICLLPWQG